MLESQRAACECKKLRLLYIRTSDLNSSICFLLFHSDCQGQLFQTELQAFPQHALILKTVMTNVYYNLSQIVASVLCLRVKQDEKKNARWSMNCFLICWKVDETAFQILSLSPAHSPGKTENWSFSSLHPHNLNLLFKWWNAFDATIKSLNLGTFSSGVRCTGSVYKN